MNNWFILFLYFVFPAYAFYKERHGVLVTPWFLLPSLVASFIQKEQMNVIQSTIMVPVVILNIYVFVLMIKIYIAEYKQRGNGC